MLHTVDNDLGKQCLSGLREVLAIIENIPTTTCGGEQPRFLFDLSFHTKGHGAVVELGSCAGRSTIVLAYGQKAKKGQRIYAIDYALHPDLKANLERAGVSDWVDLCIARSSQIARNWDRPIELLFIDANHSYLAVRRDIRCWARHVIEGGWIAFHDFGNPMYPGVQFAVHRQLRSKPLEWRTVSDREVGSLYVVERQAQMQISHGLCKMAREELSNSLTWLVGEILATMHRTVGRGCS